MIPFDAPLLRIDSEAQAVALAGGDLRGGQHAGHLAVEVQQDVAIVVQLAPRNDAGQIGDQFLDTQSADIFGELEGVDADIADRPATARARGIGSPRSEEHTSELQSLMRISYADLCLKKKK